MKSSIQLSVGKVLFLAAVMTAGALAMQAETFTLNVPFAFSAGSKMMAAGSYLVESQGNTLFLRGTPGSVALFAVPSESEVAGAAKSAATFEQGTQGSVLASVSLSNGMIYTIPVSKRVAASLTSPTDGAVLSRKH